MLALRPITELPPSPFFWEGRRFLNRNVYFCDIIRLTPSVIRRYLKFFYFPLLVIIHDLFITVYRYWEQTRPAVSQEWATK